MEYRSLGKTGLRVSRLCFGTLTIGPLQAKLPVPDGADIICHAIKSGVNFFDSAELYETYPYIREGMKKAGVFDIVISTKTYAYTREMAMRAVEDARKQLDRDIIDIFMLHEQESIYTLQGHKEALDCLMEYKAKGIINAVGASMHHIEAVKGAVSLGLDVIHPMLNKNGLGIVDGDRQAMETEIIKAHEAGIGVFSMKPLGGGNLFSDAADCLGYVRSLPYVDSVAVGMQSIGEVDANVNFFETGSFSDKDIDTLSCKTRRLHIDGWCSGCGACTTQCKQNALSVINGAVVCDYPKCVLCGYCSSACPDFAIKIV